jgi:hypothetical protein
LAQNPHGPYPLWQFMLILQISHRLRLERQIERGRASGRLKDNNGVHVDSHDSSVHGTVLSGVYSPILIIAHCRVKWIWYSERRRFLANRGWLGGVVSRVDPGTGISTTQNQRSHLLQKERATCSIGLSWWKGPILVGLCIATGLDDVDRGMKSKRSMAWMSILWPTSITKLLIWRTYFQTTFSLLLNCSVYFSARTMRMFSRRPLRLLDCPYRINNTSSHRTRLLAVILYWHEMKL